MSNKNESWLLKNPNLRQIEAAIREVDGNSKTLVTIEANSHNYMAIGSGKLGKYVVTPTFDNIKFHVVFDLANLDKIEKLVVGGQEGDYPAKMCVALLRCLLAVRTFSESGELDRLLDWHENKSLVEM